MFNLQSIDYKCNIQISFQPPLLIFNTNWIDHAFFKIFWSSISFSFWALYCYASDNICVLWAFKFHLKFFVCCLFLHFLHQPLRSLGHFPKLNCVSVSLFSLVGHPRSLFPHKILGSLVAASHLQSPQNRVICKSRLIKQNFKAFFLPSY